MGTPSTTCVFFGTPRLPPFQASLPLYQSDPFPAVVSHSRGNCTLGCSSGSFSFPPRSNPEPPGVLKSGTPHRHGSAHTPPSFLARDEDSRQHPLSTTCPELGVYFCPPPFPGLFAKFRLLSPAMWNGDPPPHGITCDRVVFTSQVLLSCRVQLAIVPAVPGLSIASLA